MKIRLNKYLSQAGICSRRKADEYITQWLIKINGKIITEMGTKIDINTDKVVLNEKIKLDQQKLEYVLFYKPEGYETTHQSSLPNEKTIYDLLPKNFKNKLYPVWRLDKDTRWLLLLTNDWVLQYHLTHPKFQHEKEYIVKIDQPISSWQLDRIQKGGIFILKRKTAPCKIFKINQKTVRIILTEGMNRQIRRIFRKIGLRVIYLKRIRIENIILPKEMKIGTWQYLKENELNELKEKMNW